MTRLIAAALLLVLTAGTVAPVAATPASAAREIARSPDGRWIAFVEPATRRRAEAIRVQSTRGGAARTLVVAGTACGKNLAMGEFRELAFFADSRRVAFQSRWGVVNGSTHIADRVTGRCRLVAAGNDVEVIQRGRYRDHLIVSMHRYFLAGGSYDWYWLLDSTGRTIGPIGDDDAAVAEFKESNAADGSLD